MLQADVFLVPQVSGAVGRFNVDVVITNYFALYLVILPLI